MDNAEYKNEPHPDALAEANAVVDRWAHKKLMTQDDLVEELQNLAELTTYGKSLTH